MECLTINVKEVDEPGTGEEENRRIKMVSLAISLAAAGTYIISKSNGE